MTTNLYPNEDKCLTCRDLPEGAPLCDACKLAYAKGDLLQLAQRLASMTSDLGAFCSGFGLTDPAHAHLSTHRIDNADLWRSKGVAGEPGATRLRTRVGFFVSLATDLTEEIGRHLGVDVWQEWRDDQAEMVMMDYASTAEAAREVAERGYHRFSTWTEKMTAVAFGAVDYDDAVELVARCIRVAGNVATGPQGPEWLCQKIATGGDPAGVEARTVIEFGEAADAALLLQSAGA